MRRRPNPYRVLAHALDVGDGRLAELLAARLMRPEPAAAPAPGPVPVRSTPAAEAAVERLLDLLALLRTPG